MVFVHSDISFGLLAEGMKRKHYLEILYKCIERVCPDSIIYPTFTYSFCNHEDYDVHNSRTYMGALNEYARKQKNRYRTLDPLLSMSVPLRLEDKFQDIGNNSLGPGSTFDTLHQLDGVKFLFFGARLGNCFTYVHHVEKVMNVPYRYDQGFEGNVIDYDGNTTYKRQFIHTQCYGVEVSDYDYFEDRLFDKGILKKARIGDLYATCVGEDDAYREIMTCIKEKPDYFLAKMYSSKDLLHKYTKGLNGERITHC